MSGGVSQQEEEWDYLECLNNFQSNQEAEKSKSTPVLGIQLEKPKDGEEPSECESLSDSEEDPLSARTPRLARTDPDTVIPPAALGPLHPAQLLLAGLLS